MEVLGPRTTGHIETKYFGKHRNSAKMITHVEHSENFNFHEALVSMYDVLDKVFDFLCYKDLINVASASESFGNIVREVLKRRLSPVLFALDVGCRLKPEPFDINPSLCMTFQGIYDKPNMRVKFSAYVCLHSKDTETRKPVIEVLENDLLPSKCPMSSLNCRQISSTFTSNISFNGIIFPTIPDVKISIFKVTDINKKILPKVLDEHIGKENNIVCLLTYALAMRKKSINNLVKTICDRQPGINFAFGGGFVLGMQSFNHIFQIPRICKKTDLLCVAFSVPKDTDGMEVLFNAYSIVIKEHATTEETIQEYLEKLKANYVPRKYGIIFRITCISREEEVDKEVKLLRNLFPDIEVFGFSGDGEIGWDCYEKSDGEENEAKPPKKKKIDLSEQKILHELTTIIVLLTWGVEK